MNAETTTVEQPIPSTWPCCGAPTRINEGHKCPSDESVTQGSAAVERLVHTQEVDGSNPSPATTGAGPTEMALDEAQRDLRSVIEEHRPALEALEAAIAAFPMEAAPIAAAGGLEQAILDASGQREVVRLKFDIQFLPHVLVERCPCGAVMECHDQPVVDHAQRAHQLEPFLCSCGRVIVAERRLVEGVRQMPRLPVVGKPLVTL